jgi:predicted CopG family antitoxin
MTVKNISIMEDVYNMLLARKKASESFSDVIRRTVKERRNINEFIGGWKHISDSEADKMKEDIKIMRKRSGEELSKKIKRLYGNLS